MQRSNCVLGLSCAYLTHSTPRPKTRFCAHRIGLILQAGRRMRAGGVCLADEKDLVAARAPAPKEATAGPIAVAPHAHAALPLDGCGAATSGTRACRPFWTCTVCDPSRILTFWSEVDFTRHRGGKRHAAREGELQSPCTAPPTPEDGRRQGAAEEGPATPEQPSERNGTPRRPVRTAPATTTPPRALRRAS